MRAILFALLYGDHFPYHNRLLASLADHVPRDQVEVRLWCNITPEATRKRALELGFPFVNSRGNVSKHQVMRELFYPERGRGFFGEIKTPWVLWLDDDSHISASDWWDETVSFIEAHQHENICYVGQPWEVQWFPGQWQFVTEQPWFSGKPSLTVNGRPGSTFACGAYFWLRTDIMHALDWPDPRISHNGGDYLLAEAIRQQGLPFHAFDYGVEVNDAPRRGLSEVPIGSSESMYEEPRRYRPYTPI